MTALKPTKGLLIFEFEPADLGQRCDLQTELGEEVSADLFRALRNDSIERFATMGIAHVITFARDQEQSDFLKEQYPLLNVSPQSGDTPAERMQFAIEDGFDAGLRQVVLLASFTPMIPLRYIESAFTLIDMFDDAIVLGATGRGGYYLMGMRRPQNDLFEYIDFTRQDLYEETLRRISATDVALYTLPSWYGLKTLDDLKRVYAEVLDNGLYMKHTASFFEANPIFASTDI